MINTLIAPLNDEKNFEFFNLMYEELEKLGDLSPKNKNYVIGFAATDPIEIVEFLEDTMLSQEIH